MRVVPCQFELTISQREEEAFDWLKRVCESMSNNPKSKNRLKAAAALIVLQKMEDKLEENHEMLHALEQKAVQQAHELRQMDLFTDLAKHSSKEGLN